jgi:DinB superfamily
MTTTNTPTSGEITVLRHQAGVSKVVVHMNLAGMTQAESLEYPTPGGNCANWVVGHLLAIQDHALPLLGQEQVLPADVRARYDRGSAGLRDGAKPLEIAELLELWNESSRRMDAGLAALDPDTLGNPAPFSPGNDPAETIGTLLMTIAWHQAYHVGQTGLLRRLAGKEGAIR